MSTAIAQRRGRLVAWVLALVAVVALVVVGLANRSPSTGSPAPALPSEQLAGGPVTLASLLGAGGADASSARSGTAGSGSGVSASRSDSSGAKAGNAAPALHGKHAALVLFWASWCTPCQQEAPAVERFARSAVGRGRIVGIDYGESELAGARAFVHRYGWSFPTLRDPDAEAGEAYGVTSLPTTFAIDARGRISATLGGPQTERSLTRALAAAEG